MRQEFQPSTEQAAPPVEGRESAFRWLARLAPLLSESDERTVTGCRDAIALVRTLQQEGQPLYEALIQRADPEEETLVATLRDALPQLDSLEEELRRRLARLAPGDPEGLVDLEAMRGRLAERAARQELGEPVGIERSPARLEAKVTAGNWAAAGGLGLFGLGWTAFTTVHAFFMIGGMWKAFGPGALALLLFYAIFFTAGFGMLAGAVNAACAEMVELEGRDLTLVRTLGPWARRRTWRLEPRSRAALGTPAVQRRSAVVTPGQPRVGTPISLLDAEGREVRFGEQAPLAANERLIERINAYLAALDP